MRTFTRRHRSDTDIRYGGGEKLVRPFTAWIRPESSWNWIKLGTVSATSPKEAALKVLKHGIDGEVDYDFDRYVAKMVVIHNDEKRQLFVYFVDNIDVFHIDVIPVDRTRASAKDVPRELEKINDDLEKLKRIKELKKIEIEKTKTKKIEKIKNEKTKTEKIKTEKTKPIKPSIALPSRCQGALFDPYGCWGPMERYTFAIYTVNEQSKKHPSMPTIIWLLKAPGETRKSQLQRKFYLCHNHLSKELENIPSFINDGYRLKLR